MRTLYHLAASAPQADPVVQERCSPGGKAEEVGLSQVLVLVPVLGLRLGLGLVEGLGKMLGAGMPPKGREGAGQGQGQGQGGAKKRDKEGSEG